jgi:hypothetical protein
MAMSKALVLGAVALAFTAAGASAQPGYDYGRSAAQSEYGNEHQAPLYNNGTGVYGYRASPYVEGAPMRSAAPIKRRHVYR